MSSFAGKKYTGKAYSRLLAGISLPGVGAGLKLLLKAVSPPQPLAGPDNNVLLANNSTFLPNAQGYSDGTSKLFWEMDMPASTVKDVTVYFVDVNGTGFAARFRPFGNDLGFLFYPVTTGTLATNPYNTFDTGLRGTLTGSKAQLNYNGLTGKCEVRADGELLGTAAVLAGLTYIRYTNYSGSGRTAISGVRYGANSTPITVSSASLASDLSVLATIAYTNTGPQADVPNIQLLLADGVTPWGAKMPALLLSNPSDGVAYLQSQTKYASAQNGTSPKFKIFEVVNGVETGAFGISSVTMAGLPLRVGVNVAETTVRYASHTSFQDHFLAGNWITTASGNAPPPAEYLDAQGYPTDAAVATAAHLIRRFHQPAETCTMELSWTQTGGADAVWAYNNGGIALSAFTPLAAQSGRRRVQFTATPNFPNTPGAWVELVSAPAGNTPKNITCYVVGADKTKILTPTRRSYNAGFKVQRWMDEYNTNGNAVSFGGTPRGWADRTTPSMGLGSGYDGIGIERCCAISNETGSDAYFNLPMYWNDDYYLNFLPLVDSLLDPTKQIYIAVGNEKTNFGFGNTIDASRTHYTARTGEAWLGSSGGGVEQLHKEIAYETRRVFELMKTTIPNFSTRVVRVHECFNDAYQYRNSRTAGFTEFDAVTASAIYVKPLTTSSDTTPAQFKAKWLTSMNSAIDNVQVPMRTAARADGVRLLGYEVGTDWGSSTAAINNQIAFQRSPEFGECMTALWSRLRLEFGDVWCQYFDVGGFGGPLSWGLKEYDTSPYAPGYDAIMAQKALAGG